MYSSLSILKYVALGDSCLQQVSLSHQQKKRLWCYWFQVYRLYELGKAAVQQDYYAVGCDIGLLVIKFTTEIPILQFEFDLEEIATG